MKKQGNLGPSPLSSGAFFAAGRKRGAPNRIPDPLQGDQKQELFPSGRARAKRTKNCARPRTHLSNSGHTRHMEPTKPARSVWIFLLTIIVAAWVALIYLAVVVTETVVAMLQYVVDLAQLY